MGIPQIIAKFYSIKLNPGVTAQIVPLRSLSPRTICASADCPGGQTALAQIVPPLKYSADCPPFNIFIFLQYSTIANSTTPIVHRK